MERNIIFTVFNKTENFHYFYTKDENKCIEFLNSYYDNVKQKYDENAYKISENRLYKNNKVIIFYYAIVLI